MGRFFDLDTQSNRPPLTSPAGGGRPASGNPTGLDESQSWVSSPNYATLAVPAHYNTGEYAGRRNGRLAFLFLLLFTIILLAPPEVFGGGDYPLALIFAISAAIFYLGARLIGQCKLRVTSEVALMFGLSAWFLIAIPFSTWKSNSVQVFTQSWLKTLIIFFLLSQTLVSLDRVRKLLWVMVACALVVNAYTLVAQRSIALTENVRVVGANWGFLSGNYLGIATATLFPFFTVMFMTSRSVVKSLLLFGAFAASVGMLVLTASRGGALSTFLSLFLIWLLLLRTRFKYNIAAALCLMTLGIALVSAPPLFWQRLGTLNGNTKSEAAASAEESSEQRALLLQRSVKYTFQHPLFGIGMGNFPIVSGTESGDSTGWYGTHNTFTQLSSENGLPGVVLFAVLLFSIFRNAWRINRSSGSGTSHEELRLYARAMMIAVVSFAFSGFFAHLAYDYYIYYLAAISAGLQTAAKAELGDGYAAPRGVA